MKNGNFSSSQAPVVATHQNLDQEVIQITQDKLKLVLSEYIQISSGSRDWLAPLSIFLTVLITLLTTDFKKSFLLAAETWFAIFIIVAMTAFFASIYFFLKKKRIITLDELIEKIKNK